MIEVELKNEIWTKINNPKEMEKWITEGGWKNNAEFKKDTGIHPNELLDTYFQVIHNRVFTADSVISKILDRENSKV